MRKPDIVLTIPEAADRLSLSVTRLRSIIAEGRIPTQAVGPLSVIRLDDLNRFAAVERKPGRPRKVDVDAAAATGADTGGAQDES